MDSGMTSTPYGTAGRPYSPCTVCYIPIKMGAIVDSFIDRANKNKAEGSGIVVGDEFCTAKEFAAGQGGNDIDNAIVDA